MSLPACSRRRRAVTAGVAGALVSVWIGRGAHAEDLTATIARAKPSVLPVGTYGLTDSPRFGFRGSGFVVGDGTLLVTNYHVLPPGAESESGPKMAAIALPGLNGGELRAARILATDRLHDLVVLKLDGQPLGALALAEPDAAREGQSVVLMGFPIGGVLGFAPVSHRGIVASITSAALPAPSAQQLDARALSRLRDGNYQVIQLDATAYPGNSGGPLLDAATGRVLGIVNSVLVKGSRETALTSPSGITYAVPVRHLIELLDSIRR